VAVANRTEARARALAAELGARAVALPWDGAMARLGEFSVVMGATAAEGAVVSLRDVEAAMARRRAEPLFLMDLALPRDFDPEAARVENVFLYNLDDLARIAARNRAAREGELARARKGIGERAARWWASAGGA
jgi:glutamyl-tRNA reductase